MFDLTWLVSEAQKINHYFSSIFYVLITVFLLLGIIVEYFKLPLGGAGSIPRLVGRVFISAILLSTYGEISNVVTGLSDEVASNLGNLSSFEGVLVEMGKKIEGYSPDWLSARSLVVTGLSFLTYTFLFYSVVIAEVAHLFSLTLLFVFSPLLICLFVFPSTSGATKALYRSLIEVCFWKITWAVLASLLWSSVLVEVSYSTSTLSFIKLICINLMLGASLLATPWVVHSLSGSGVSALTRSFGTVATAFGAVGPARAFREAKKVATPVKRMAKATKRYGSNALRKRRENKRKIEH